MKHNLNSADAIHLAAAISERDLTGSAEAYYFVCCDKRLLSAAKKEKFDIINPETMGDNHLLS